MNIQKDMEHKIEVKPYRIVVAGGRDFSDYQLLEKTLDQYLENCFLSDVVIVSGGARGADRLGERYARKNGIDLKLFPADWDKYGKSAGYIRNEEMAKYGTHVVLFWNGESRGTKHMYDLAKKYKRNCTVIKYETEE